MSLVIDTNKVTRVLLHDGWHVVAKQSFDLDSYELVWDGNLIHRGGESGICPTGFTFVQPNGLTVSGPFTSVLAIEQKG